MTDALNTIAAIVTIFTGIVAIIFAIPSYVRNSNVRRAEWLSSLFEKFYESKIYPLVRDIIDYNVDVSTMDDLELLIAAAFGYGTDVRQARIVLNNYLNFFEFVANLKVLNQLKETELNLLFSYDLGLLKKSRVLWQYIDNDENEFENLKALLAVR
jgi:hypothetical protein